MTLTMDTDHRIPEKILEHWNCVMELIKLQREERERLKVI